MKDEEDRKNIYSRVSGKKQVDVTGFEENKMAAQSALRKDMRRRYFLLQEKLHGVCVPVDLKKFHLTVQVSIHSVIKFLHVLHVPSMPVCMVLS